MIVLNIGSHLNFIQWDNEAIKVPSKLTWLRAGRPCNPASIHGKRKLFFSFPKRPDRLWSPPLSYPRVSDGEWDVKLSTPLHQVPRLRMNAVTLYAPVMLSGRTAQSSTTALTLKAGVRI